MINTKTTGYRSLSYCLPLIIYILLVFPHSIATSQLNLSSCLLQCRLSIKEGPRAHVNFTQMLKTESIRAIFFDLYIGNKTTHIGTRRTIFYAWIKKNLGKGVFTLPSDYIALTFSLYAVFISKLKISFQESSPGCYHRFHDDYCKGYITFAALTDFTRLKENCTNDSCGTICRRNYTKHDGWLGDKIVFSCCHKDLLTGDINIDKCLTEERADWYVSLMQAVSTIISIHLGGMALNRFINKYLDSQILYTTIGSIRVRILNPSPLQDLGYTIRHKSESSYRYKPIVDSLKYLLLPIVSFATASASYLIQKFPLMFMIFPKTHLEIPFNIKKYVLAVGVPLIISTVTIVVAHLKLFCYGANHNIQTEHHRHFTRTSYRQSYLLMITYITDAIHHIRLFNLTGFILNILAFTFAFPFFLFAQVSTFRTAVFLSERLTLKLRKIYMPNSRKWPFINRILSFYLSFLCHLYSFMHLALLWISFQIVFRIIVSIIAFVITYSTYFTLAVVIGIPFIHYIVNLIKTYNKNCSMIPTRIIKVKDKVEDEMNALLNAKKGVLEVYLANGYDEIKIDVPAKLKDPKVMKNLKKYISWILNQPHHQIFDGISKIVIQYEIKTVNDNQKQTTVSLLQCTNGCENCPYSQGFQQVKHCIENHLNINNSQDFIKWTKQVYFIHDDIAHHKLISIPSELYQYLRYYVPMISSSLWRLISSIILASGLLFIFVLTILLDYRTQLFSSLNSALAHVPNIYLATILSMNYLVATEIDEETIDRILIANIIQYRRGYRLFLERGIYFQPILQSFRATFEHYHRKNKTIKFYIPEVDSNSNRSVGSTVSSGNQSVITTEANSDITQSINSPSTEIATDSAFQLNTGHSAAEIHNVQTIDDAYKDGVEEEISIHENQSNQANSLIYKGEIQFRLIFKAIKNIFIRTSNSSENSAIAERVGIKGEREPLVDKFATDPIA
ncbi:hypothetical protein TrispH2_008794 [Trichoplax sp. H2]|nr:hypothetical protein TrispH2_008794 [Trichoplax sp. H2]|eukprot:RDD39959.1 hypothetical protein TrispH2_008794 [Trichoplax sp. H2]